MYCICCICNEHYKVHSIYICINKAIDSVYKPVSQGPRFSYGSLAHTYLPGGWGKKHFHRILLTLRKDFQNPYI